MRIAFIAISYTKQPDGISVYIENLLSEIETVLLEAKKSARIDVFVCGESAKLLKSVLDKRKARKAIEVYKGGNRIEVNFFSSEREGWFSKYIKIPWKVRRSGSYDLIVMPNFQPLLFLPKRKVSVLHDLTYKKAIEYFPNWRRVYMGMLTQFRLKIDDAIGVVSNTTKNDIGKYFPVAVSKKSLIYMPNGIPFKLAAEEMLSSQEMEDKFTTNEMHLLFVGRINRLKGFDKVLNACAALDQYLTEKPKFLAKLHVAGKEMPESKELLHGLAFNNVEIKRYGYVHNKALNGLYRSCEFCFLLSSNEGFGLPIIESLWLGCMPILSDIPIFREITGPEFPLFDTSVGYEQKIVDFIVRLREDQKFRHKMLGLRKTIINWHKNGYRVAAKAVLKIAKSSG